MKENNYQMLAQRQALLMHRRLSVELTGRTDFLAYVYEATKAQTDMPALLAMIQAKVAEYKDGKPNR